MKYKLSDLFDITSGGTPLRRKTEYYENGKIKWVKTGDLKEMYLYNTDECITELGFNNSSTRMYVPDTVLIAMYGATIGATSILKINACTNQACAAFSPNEEVLPEFLYYFLKSKKSQFIKDGVGGAQPNISAGYLRNIELDLLEITEQKEIIGKITKVEKVIRNREKQLKLLDNLIKSRFVEMFGNLEEDKSKFEKYPLDKYLNVIGGYAFKADQFEECGIPILRIGNINSGYFRDINLVFWKYDEKLSRYLVYPGDLTISLTGTVGKDDYGNVCILDNTFEKYYLNQRNAKLEILGDLNKIYLSEILKFKKVKIQLTGISRGVRQANISNKDILNLKIPVPPLTLQNEFADFVRQVDKSKFAIQQSLDEMQILYDSLMQEYFG